MALSPNDFCHLHVHSEYSLLDGANRIGPMLKHVKETLGQDTIALTDHGVLFGALEFYKTARAQGVKPIIGCEVYITPTNRGDRGPQEKKNTHHLLLLAENYEGYRNLCKLSSIGYTEGFYYKPRIDFETLEAHKGGLIATSSCLAGLIPQRLLDRQEAKAADFCGKFVDMFGPERFFIELMDHGLREQSIVNSALLDIAKRQNLKLIATNDAHYMRREDAELHDCLLCVQTGSRLADKNRMRFDASEFYLKSTAEMLEKFGDLPESLTNTRLVAEMCNVEMPERQYRIPKFPCPDGMGEDEYLRQQVWEGAHRIYGNRADNDTDLRDRIEFELKTIIGMGFPGYFLITADFINHARSIGIPVGPGRGSAAGSVVAYCLGITQLCPLEHGLLFERFLNPDRISMPDIDIDFCFERRSEVIEYVRKKYGEKCVAQIITFGTMKAKAAVRDMGRVMDLPLDVVNRVAKAVPNDLKMTIPKAKEESADLRTMMEQDPQIRRLVDTAEKVEGMVRHASTHAAGIIISDQDITEYAPLYKPPAEDRPATQFTMTECEEDLGLLKMDFLGIKNLTIIERVRRWLKEREGIDIDWDEIPMSDPKTYEILQAGKTLGVFQLESGGMTNLVKRLKPTEFADLTALLALYRPGPLGANMHTMYVDRKHGREQVEFDHEVLKPILQETYGVILYQEQVMRISMAMSGFTRGEADKLRKAMGKKKMDVMAPLKEKWVANAPATSGVSEELAEKIWNDVLSFASYGFNKSHSAAYAVVTFQTAYLRAHYPTYFAAALLTNEINGTSDAIAKYVTDCRESGIEVMAANINRSREYFDPDGDRVWFALNGIKGVGTGFARGVMAEREANGPFRSLQDFCLRMPQEHLNSRVVEALVKVGAFDELHPNRAALLGALPDIMALAGDVHRAEASGVEDMFAADEDSSDSMVEEIRLPNVEPPDDKERAEYEKEFLGFYLSDHPLKRYEIEMRSFATVTAADLDSMAQELQGDKRAPVTMMGCIVDIMRRETRKGDVWAIVKMEDLTGSFEVKFWNREYLAFHEELQLDNVIQVGGMLGTWNDAPSVTANTARSARDLRGEAKGIDVEWHSVDVTPQALFELQECCRRFAGPKAVRVVVRENDTARVHYVPQKTRIALTPDAMEELRRLPGRPKLSFIRPRTSHAARPARASRAGG